MSHDDAPELPAGVPPPVPGIVSRCLQKRPDGRFHSAHDLALALELLPTTTSVSTATALPRPQAPVVSRRQALVCGASSIGLLGAGASGGAWLAGTRESPGPPSLRRLPQGAGRFPDRGRPAHL